MEKSIPRINRIDPVDGFVFFPIITRIMVSYISSGHDTIELITYLGTSLLHHLK